MDVLMLVYCIEFSILDVNFELHQIILIAVLLNQFVSHYFEQVHCLLSSFT